jgi:hypothetical protein
LIFLLIIFLNRYIYEYLKSGIGEGVYMKKMKIWVLSGSRIKRDAVLSVFGLSGAFLHFIDLPENPERASQPIYREGIEKACSQRINEFLRLEEYTLDEDDCILSIENGIIPADSDEIHWVDVCIVGVWRRGWIKYYQSRVEVPLERKYTDAYFGGFNKEFDTLGKYISYYEKEVTGKEIPHNNWMRCIAGVDRVDQIRDALLQVVI